MTDCVTGTARCAHIAGEKDDAELAAVEDWETVSGSSEDVEEDEEMADTSSNSVAAESTGYTDTPADTPQQPPVDMVAGSVHNEYVREPVPAIPLSIPHTQVP